MVWGRRVVNPSVISKTRLATAGAVLVLGLVTGSASVAQEVATEAADQEDIQEDTAVVEEVGIAEPADIDAEDADGAIADEGGGFNDWGLLGLLGLAGLAGPRQPDVTIGGPGTRVSRTIRRPRTR